MTNELKPEQPKEKSAWTWYRVLLIICIGLMIIASALTFAIYGLNRTNSHRLFHEEEAGGYLGAIADAAVLGGPLHMVQNLISGDYIEANRQPFFVYLFSVFYQPEYDFFVFMKMATYIIGILMVIVIGIIAYIKLGLWPCVLTTGFLAVNQYMIFQSTLISCESMLLIFFFLAWIYLSEGYNKQKNYIWGAIFLAITYMVKGTGMYLLGMFILSLIIVYNRHIFSKLLKRKEIWIAGGTFLLICLPFFIRNIVVYKTPLYNVNMDYMWLNSFGQHYWAGDHSFNKFLGEHGWDGIWGMFQKGMADELDSLQNLLKWEFAAESHQSWYVGILFAVFILFVIGLIGDKNQMRSVMTFLLFVFFFIFFSWWARYSTLLRFILPILPILLAYAGMGIATIFRLGAKLIKNKRVIDWVPRLSWLVPIAVSAILFIHLYPSLVAKDGNPRYIRRTIAGTYELRAGYEELVKFQQEVLKDGDLVLTGHDGTFQTRWLINKKINMDRFTLFEKPEEFLAYLDEEKPALLVFHTKPWRDVERMVAPYVRWDKEKKEFIFLESLPNYEPVKSLGADHKLYLVYQRVENIN